MNYAEKKAARIERLRSRADAKRTKAGAAFQQDRAIHDSIPMGQPILVGHHSEKRHRRDIRRADNAMRKGIALERDAQELERRADAAETSTAVSSDDPDALQKLDDKIAKAEAAADELAAINRAIGSPLRSLKRTDKQNDRARTRLAALGIKPATIEQLLKPGMCDRIGIPAYELTNARGNIRRMKTRRDRLVATRAIAGRSTTIGETTVEIDDNRVRLFFPGKPGEETRTKLKRHGFRWARSVGAWQRHASEQAWAIANEIAAGERTAVAS